MTTKPQITVTGNLVADPELRTTQNGKPWVSFRLAATPRTYNRDTNQWVDGETLWLNCTMVGQGAENVANSLTKGSQVVAVGKLGQRQFTDNQGQQRTSIDLEVDEIGASLKFAQVQVIRAPQNNNGGAASWGAPTAAAAQPAWGVPAGTQAPAQNIDTTAF